MKRFIAFVLSLAVLSLSSIGLASGASYYDTSEKIVETAKNRVVLNNLVKEYLAQQEGEPPRVVSEIVSLWNENGINITLPEKEYGARINDGRSYDRYIVIKGNNNDSFEILYNIYYDGSKDDLTIWIPTAYRHLRKALALAISYYTEKNITDAYAVYDSLRNEISGSQAQITIDNIWISLFISSNIEKITIERRSPRKESQTASPTADPITSSVKENDTPKIDWLDYFSNLFKGLKSDTSKRATTPPISALSSISPPLITGNFAGWSNMFGFAEIVEKKIESAKISGSLYAQTIDDLIVYYDSSTFETKAVTLDFIYLNSGDMQRTKALAFFAAIEKGSPDFTDSVSLAKDNYLALEISEKIFDKMLESYDSEKEDIFKGQEVIFYYGDRATYSLLLEDNILIIVAR